MTWQSSIKKDLQHITQESGRIYYVSTGSGDDSNDGLHPDDALKTIAAGLAKLSSGDALKVKIGVYVETGLDLDVNGCRLIFDIGEVRAPGTCSGLIISGNHCMVLGNLDITTPAGETGLLVSGDSCLINLEENITVSGGAIGFSITGSWNTLENPMCSNQTSTGFDISGTGTRLIDPSTFGTGGATKGYYIHAGADSGRLINAASSGHADNGFYVDSGSSGWIFSNASSGAGDGPRIDVDGGNAWNNFSYPDTASKRVTFTTTGLQTYPLFRVDGVVKITSFTGHVETDISSNMDDFHIELDDGTTVTDMSKDDGDASALPINSFIVKEEEAGDKTIDIYTSINAMPIHKVDAKKEPFRVIQKTGGVSTYIRLSCTSTDTPPSGVIHWYCKWTPETEYSYLEAV